MPRFKPKNITNTRRRRSTPSGTTPTSRPVGRRAPTVRKAATSRRMPKRY